MNLVAEKMAPVFKEAGYPLPPYRLSIGFTSAGESDRVAGECWSPSSSDDGSHEIFIAPGQSESDDVAATLCHELIHAAVGLKEGHKGPFRIMAKHWGLAGKMTATTAGPRFKAWMEGVIEELGEIPHANLRYGRRAVSRAAPAAPESGQEIESRAEEPASTRPPKEATRMLKASCEECGYTVRVTRKWLEIGPPHCPNHGAMTTEE